MKETFFGFKKVASEAKANLVNQVFSSVAGKYDIMNDLMSFGIHRLWKDELVKEIKASKDLNIIDMAGGTGDVAFKIFQKLKKYDEDFSIKVADFNQKMLDYGAKKAIDKNIIGKQISWHEDNGEKSQFSDNEFDYYIISYGIRNFTNLEKGVEEAYRILKKGGKFLCLEFNQVENDILKKIYDFYSFKIMPKIGKLITGDKESYEYFVESIRMFPESSKFGNMLENAGFKNVSFRKLSLGLTTLYVGEK